MKLPKEAITEYRDIYRNKIGVNLPYKEAEAKAINFLQLMALISIKPKNENGKYTKSYQK